MSVRNISLIAAPANLHVGLHRRFGSQGLADCLGDSTCEQRQDEPGDDQIGEGKKEIQSFLRSAVLANGKPPQHTLKRKPNHKKARGYMYLRQERRKEGGREITWMSKAIAMPQARAIVFMACLFWFSKNCFPLAISIEVRLIILVLAEMLGLGLSKFALVPWMRLD